jgi:hypothetical protein
MVMTTRTFLQTAATASIYRLYAFIEPAARAYRL